MPNPKMYKRNIFNYLVEWKNALSDGSKSRKPLVLRGARQVGKTTAVEMFGEHEFQSFIKLNLEKSDHARIFQKVQSAKEVTRLIEQVSGQRLVAGQTLLFIDEIQASDTALSQLRYFHEEMPNLHVIAAGSLLDVFLERRKISVPVGRVEYCYMHPFTFTEFLQASIKKIDLERIAEFKVGDHVDLVSHDLFMKSYLEYALIGGMPEIVAKYTQTQSISSLDLIYESLMTAYRDDIGKYVAPGQAAYLRHCLENAPRSVGLQVTYNHFGESSYRSREIGLAFDLLELALLLRRIWSTRALALPLVPNKNKAPKLIFLDAGLVNYKLAQRNQILNFSQLENAYQGQLSEQLVGQALHATGVTREAQLNYWYRDKKGSSAEVDYIIDHGSSVIAIEVKPGASARLKSLHAFIDQSKAKFAVRISSRPPNVEDSVTSQGNKFTLISLPYYLIDRLRELV